MRIGLPSGHRRAAFSSRLARTWPDQHVVDLQQGQIGCRVDVHPAPRDQAVDGGEGLVHQLVEGHEGGPDGEGPGLDAGHVEQVGDQTGQPIGLELDQLEQLGAIGVAQGGAVLAQAGDGRLDRGQRRAQIVRDRSHHGAAPAVDLLEQAGAQGLVLQLRPLDGQSRLVGKRSEQGPVLPGELHLLEDEQAHGAVAGHERHGDPARRSSPVHAQRPDLSAARRERRQLVGRELLTGPCRHDRARAPSPPAGRAAAGRSSAVQRGAKTVCTVVAM